MLKLDTYRSITILSDFEWTLGMQASDVGENLVSVEDAGPLLQP